MPVGTNPGIYIDIIATPFANDVSNDSTHSLFIGFSRKGIDNKLQTIRSANDALQKLGYPKKYMYGQQVFNAYNHSIVSGNTKFLRILPNVEDYSNITDVDLLNQVMPSPATFSNVNFMKFNSSSTVLSELIVPVNFVPSHWKDGSDTITSSGLPSMVQTIYKYEAEDAQDNASTIGDEISISRSSSLAVFYDDEPTDITVAGSLSNNQDVEINYSAFLEAFNEYYADTSAYSNEIKNFIKNVDVTTSLSNLVTNITGSVAIATGHITVPAPGIYALFHYNTTTKMYDIAILDFATTSVTAPSGWANGETVTYYKLAAFNKLTTIAANDSFNIPSYSKYIVYACSGIDFNRSCYSVVPAKDSGGNDCLKITNLVDTPIVVAYQEDETGVFDHKNYNIREVILTLKTDEISSTISSSYQFVIDKLTDTLGWGVLPFIDNMPLVSGSYSGSTVLPESITYNLSADDRVTVELTNSSPKTYVVRLIQISGNDPAAKISGKILMSVLAEGRGGWYNNLAIELKPKGTATSNGKIVPDAMQYVMSVKSYVSALKTYVGVGTPLEFSIDPAATDETGNSIFAEYIINNYGSYIQAFTNKELIKELLDAPATSNKFKSRYDQLFYMMSKCLSSTIRLNGGEDGCLRNRTDCSINWKVGNSILVLAANGVYDEAIYDTDNVRLDAVFDADFAVPVKKALINLCELRQDCVAYLDASKNVSVDNLINWVDNSFSTSSYYAALFAPHIKVYDPFEKDYIWMGPSYTLSYMVPFNDFTNGFYQPLSGTTRGVLKHDVKKFGINIPLTELSSSQQATYLRAVNVLGKKKGINLVWGNYTCTTKNTALQSLHVARIMTRLVWEFRSLSDSIWDLATPANLNSIRARAVSILNQYMGTAIDSFDVKLLYDDYDRQRRTVRLQIAIKPYLEIRRIYITFTVS